MAVALAVKEGNLRELQYLEKRAEDALNRGDIRAHVTWARKWHSLNAAMGG